MPLKSMSSRPLPKLEDGEVQVFHLWANGNREQFDFAMSVLSQEERERAAKYRMERARDEFVVGRAALRVLLGSAMGLEAKDVPLRQDRFGKPTVPGIECNVAHSRGLVYVAVSRNASVGVDVEWIDVELEAMELASANFTADEARSLASLPAREERATAFYRIWTRKEAVAKADGRGLRIPLREIALPDKLPGLASLPSCEGAESVVTRQGLPQGSIQYQLSDLEAPRGFAAAWSVRGSDSPMVCRFFLLDLPSSGVS